MRYLPVLVALCGFGHPLVAQEWTQWRGASRDGTVVSEVLPTTWPTSTKHVWKVDVGEGYSSPVVSNGRVFVHSRIDPDEIVTAVDIATGKVLWRQTYPAAFAKNQYAVQMAKGPNSTPIVVAERVYTLGVTGILSAWKTADGSLAWRKDFAGLIDTSKLFCGTAMSPMLEGGKLIVQVGSDVHGGRVLALDPVSGAEVWAWKGAGPGYASPVAFTAGGVRQIVTLTNESIVGIDASTGASLWSVPFADEWHENIVTPIWTGTHLIVTGVRQGTQAYTIAQESGTWQPRQAWKNADVTMYTSAPVVADGTVYGISAKRKGQFVALDAASGALRWSSSGREGEHASVMLTPKHVLFLTNAGDLVVTRREAATFVEERRIELDASETWAVPAFVQGGLLVRDARSLVRLAWAS